MILSSLSLWSDIRLPRFLLPRLYLDRLGCQTSVRNLRRALESLPTNLDQTYDEAMARIQGQVQEHSELALSALSWISNTLRPLRLDELQHALAVRLGDHNLDKEALEDEALIVSISAGLITVDVESRTIRLVHFTVEEYFKKMKQKWFPDADSRITETCITYLSFDAFEDGRCFFDQELEFRLQENCFLDYAARNWGIHACRADEHSIEDLALDFLSNDHKVSISSQIMLMPEYHYRGYSSNIPDQVFGVHLTAHFGLMGISSRLLEVGTVADSKDSYGRTPLSWAAERGHEAIAELLLSRDDVAADSHDKYGRTPLLWAAEEGHEAIAKLLLSRGDVAADSQDRGGRTPLSWAAEEGHEAIAKLLLSRGDVAADSQDRGGRTPLLWAAMGGHEAIVKLLLSRDDVAADSQHEYGRTPLSWAAIGGHEAIAKLLLSRDDVAADSQDEDGRTPLSYTAMGGHEAIAKLLLSRDDVAADSQDRDGRTPLLWAAKGGHKAIAKLLLSRDDVAADSQDEDGRTPLLWAAMGGYEAIAKLLLSRDDVAADSQDEYGRTPLSWAARRGHEAIAKLLLSRDDVAADSQDEDGRTLSRDDVAADSQDRDSRTPLSCAAKEGHEAIVKLLLSRGDVAADSKDEKMAGHRYHRRLGEDMRQ